MSNFESKSKSKQVYQPPVWRLILGVFVLPVAAAFLGWVAMYLPELLKGRYDHWLDNSSFVLSFAFAALFWSVLLIGLNRDWYTIEVDEVSITGQANYGGRKVILRSALDKERTRRRSLTDKLLGIWKVWDTKGNKIVIPGLYFPSDQIAAILKALDCE